MPRSALSKAALSSAKSERLEARVSPRQKALLQQAAALQGRDLAEFVTASLNEAAQRVVEDRQIVRLSGKESRTFANALLKPRNPSRRLQAAARRYLAMIGD